MKGQQQEGRARLLVAADGLESLSSIWRERFAAEEFTVRDWDLRCLNRPYVNPSIVRAWRDYVVELHHGLELCDFIQKTIENSSVFKATSGQLLVLFAVSRNERRPNLLPAWGKMCVGIGLYMDIPPDKLKWLEAARNLHETVLSGCLRLDGRPYLAAGVDVASVSDRIAFKEYWEAQELLRRHVDPDSLMWNYCNN